MRRSELVVFAVNKSIGGRPVRFFTVGADVETELPFTAFDDLYAYLNLPSEHSSRCKMGMLADSPFYFRSSTCGVLTISRPGANGLFIAAKDLGLASEQDEHAWHDALEDVLILACTAPTVEEWLGNMEAAKRRSWEDADRAFEIAEAKQRRN